MTPDAAPVLHQIRGAHVHLSGLPGLIDATRRAHAVIGVDSGPLHLAAALAKPGVAIYGPTDPARNGPYFPSDIAVRNATPAETTHHRGNTISPAMLSISVEQLEDAIVQRLTVQRWVVERLALGSKPR